MHAGGRRRAAFAGGCWRRTTGGGCSSDSLGHAGSHPPECGDVAINSDTAMLGAPCGRRRRRCRRGRRRRTTASSPRRGRGHWPPPHSSPPAPGVLFHGKKKRISKTLERAHSQQTNHRGLRKKGNGTLEGRFPWRGRGGVASRQPRSARPACGVL